MPTIQTIVDDFAVLDDWDDRYRYLIELGRALEPLAPELHTEHNRVKGCASQVWIDTRRTLRDGQPVLTFLGDSDAHIVRGLIAITLALLSGRAADDILATDAAETFRTLGLSEHLTPQRSNGVRAMVERIRRDARTDVEAALAS